MGPWAARAIHLPYTTQHPPRGDHVRLRVAALILSEKQPAVLTLNFKGSSQRHHPSTVSQHFKTMIPSNDLNNASLISKIAPPSANFFVPPCPCPSLFHSPHSWTPVTLLANLPLPPSPGSAVERLDPPVSSFVHPGRCHKLIPSSSPRPFLLQSAPLRVLLLCRKYFAALLVHIRTSHRLRNLLHSATLPRRKTDCRRASSASLDVRSSSRMKLTPLS